MHNLILTLPWYDEAFTVIIITQAGTSGLESWNHIYHSLSHSDVLLILSSSESFVESGRVWV